MANNSPVNNSLLYMGLGPEQERNGKMNATQIGNLIKSGLLALGVSSTVIGYVSAEVWVAVGGAVVAIGTVIWQVVANKTASLIATVADEPEVVKVVLDDEPLADSIPSRKVVAK